MLSDLIAFVATTKASEALTFYRDVVGLRLVADEPHALVFDVNGTMLRVQKVEALSPHPFTALGWRVDDIAAAMTSLEAKGVRFERFSFLPQDDQGVWTTPDGAKIAWFRDPDGNTLSLTQW